MFSIKFDKNFQPCCWVASFGVAAMKDVAEMYPGEIGGSRWKEVVELILRSARIEESRFATATTSDEI